MKRRNFILLSAVGIAAVGVPVWYFKYYKDDEAKIDQPEELSLIWDEETLRTIGIQYRNMVTEEDDQMKLESLLEANNKEAIDNLKQSIINDFQTGNTIQLDGWILAVTEARQCALFSLTHQTS